MGNCLQIGRRAPNFVKPAVYQNQIGKIRLSDYVGKKYVILIFYSLNFNASAMDELLHLNGSVTEFRRLGAIPIAVSIDSPLSHLQFLVNIQSKYKLSYLRYPIISDITKELARRYHTLTGEGTSIPAIFIIDKDGLIQYHTTHNILCNKDMEEVFRVLRLIKSANDERERQAAKSPFRIFY